MCSLIPHSSDIRNQRVNFVAVLSRNCSRGARLSGH